MSKAAIARLQVENKVLQEQLEECQKKLHKALADQVETDAFFKNHIQKSMSRLLPRKPPRRKIRDTSTLAATIPQNVFRRLFPSVAAAQGSDAKQYSFQFDSLHAVESETGTSSRLHKKADEASTK
jgi:hypothetical protein